MLRLLYILTLITFANCQSITNKIHKTKEATEKKNDLYCYNCNTTDDGDKCVSLNSTEPNFSKKCKSDEFICMIKRFSYTTSNENSTSTPRMWSLERRCTNLCEPGCIIIGERTKLYACTSCCENSLCNTGKGSASLQSLHHIMFLFVNIFVFINFNQPKMISIRF